MPEEEKTIEQRASFEIIRYANCWEDSELLLKSLNLNNEKSCLSIASAGDNSLSLLVGNPKLVIAVDLSQAQLACVEIRKIAFAELDYQELKEFLGFEPTDSRLDTYYKKIQKNLSPEAKAFWNSHKNFIAEGVIYHGKFERYFSFFRKYALPLVHSTKKVKQLLERKSLAEQKAFYDEKWNTWSWRLMFRFFFSRLFMGRVGRDAEFFRYVEGSVADNILKRTRYALTEIATHSNPYLNFILMGSYQKAIPFYMKEKNVEIIRNNLSVLQLFRGSASQAIDHFDVKFDAYNLSDIFEYIDEGLFKKVSEDLLRKANPKARLAYWNMLVPRSIAKILPDKVKHLKGFSDELFLKDRAFFYRSFAVDEVL